MDWAQVGLVGVDLDEDVSGRQTLRLGGARANIDRCLAQRLRFRADLHLDPG